MQSAEGESRIGIGRIAVLALGLFMLLRVFLLVSGADTGRAATPSPTPGPGRSSLLAPSGPAAGELLRPVLSDCGEATDDVGLYAAMDPVCRPSKTLTLAELTADSQHLNLLQAGESLQRLGQGEQPACAYVVMSNNRVWGWLCADAYGLYRADSAGWDQGSGARWQWSTREGKWVNVRP